MRIGQTVRSIATIGENAGKMGVLSKCGSMSGTTGFKFVVWADSDTVFNLRGEFTHLLAPYPGAAQGEHAKRLTAAIKAQIKRRTVRR